MSGIGDGDECPPVRRGTGASARRPQPAWEDRDLWRQQRGVSPAAQATESKSFSDLRRSRERSQTLFDGSPTTSNGRGKSSRLRKALVRPSINPVLSTWTKPMQQRFGQHSSVYRTEAEKAGPTWLPPTASTFNGLIKAQDKTPIDRYRSERAAPSPENSFGTQQQRFASVPKGIERALTQRGQLAPPDHLLRPYTSLGFAPSLAERPVRRPRSVAASNTRCWTPFSQFESMLYERPRRSALVAESSQMRAAQREGSRQWTPPHLRPPAPAPATQAMEGDWDELDMRLVEEDAMLHNARQLGSRLPAPRVHSLGSPAETAACLPDKRVPEPRPLSSAQPQPFAPHGDTDPTYDDPLAHVVRASEPMMLTRGRGEATMADSNDHCEPCLSPSPGQHRDDAEAMECGEPFPDLSSLGAKEKVKADTVGTRDSSWATHEERRADDREGAVPWMEGSTSVGSLSRQHVRPPPAAPPEKQVRGRGKSGQKSVNVLDSAWVPYSMETESAREDASIVRELPVKGKEAGWEEEKTEELCGDEEVASYYGSFGRPEEKRVKWHKYNLKVKQVNEREEASTRGKDMQAQRRGERAMRVVEHRNADGASSQLFQRCLHDVNSSRPYFQLPGPERRVYKATNSKPGKRKPPSWSMHDSIFVRRLRQCDAKDFVDNERVLGKAHAADWERVVKKNRFRNFIARKDKALLDEAALEDELQQVKEALWHNLDPIRSAFYYYSMMGASVGESAFSMSLNNWTSFTYECRIIEPSKSSPVSQTVLDTLFITVNFEDDKRSEESKENDDLALMRFEWYEIIVRTAVLKYGDGRETSDISDAVSMLVERNLRPNLPLLALSSPNDFRLQRLYTFEVDQTLQAHLPFLEAVYDAYRVDDITNYFWMKHWIKLLEDCLLIGSHTGVSKFETKLIFARSKMAVIDEMKRRQRAVSQQFIDFLEALAQLADWLSLPTPEDLEAWMQKAHHELGDYPFWAYNKTISSGMEEPLRRDSAELQPKSRPLHVKLDSFLNLMVGALCEVWDEVGEKQVTAKMRRVVHKLTMGRRKPSD